MRRECCRGLDCSALLDVPGCMGIAPLLKCLLSLWSGAVHLLGGFVAVSWNPVADGLDGLDGSSRWCWSCGDWVCWMHVAACLCLVMAYLTAVRHACCLCMHAVSRCITCMLVCTPCMVHASLAARMVSALVWHMYMQAPLLLAAAERLEQQLGLAMLGGRPSCTVAIIRWWRELQ